MDNSELTLRFVESLDSEADATALIARFRDILGQLGLSSFFCLRQRVDHPDPECLARIWPDDWDAHYWAQNYVTVDPVCQTVWQGGGPVVWREVPAPTGTVAKRVMDEAREFGLADGIAFAVRGPRSMFFSLASNAQLERREAVLAHFCSIYFGSKLERFLGPANPCQPILTQREHDCLRWVARGKTDWEIGCILGISHYTAAQHITSVMRKLNASNRTHAVAVALLQHTLHL